MHHLHRVFGHLARRAFLASPIRISEFCDDIPTLFQRAESEKYVEFTPQRRLHANFDIVVVDEDGDVQSVLHQIPFLSSVPFSSGTVQSGHDILPSFRSGRLFD